MYKSPIELLVDNIQYQIVKQQDEEIYKAVCHYVPNVDKEELIRALNYDRNQYERGYADGKADAMPRWIPVTERLPTPYEKVFTCRRELLGGTKIICNEYITVEYGGVLAWSADHETWKTSVTHWMPLPEPPKGE